MKHHIWYLDIIAALQQAAEGLIVARNLADGVDALLHAQVSHQLVSVEGKIKEALSGFADECCQCEGPNETYTHGFTCEADGMKKGFRLSTDYKKNDPVLWLRKPAGAAGGQPEQLPGKITSTRVAPDGAIMFGVRLDKGARGFAGQTVELTWRDIRLNIERVAEASAAVAGV